MIQAQKHYPSQMNGPVISAFGEGINNEFSEANEIIDYLYNLKIDNAQETELENIGRLIGYTRPLVPDGFDQENIFLFGDEPISYDTTTGFGSVGQTIGGQLASTEATSGNKMSLGNYRQLLKQVAYLKRHGFTLSVIDKIASQMSTNYEISWDENHDIHIIYRESIGFKNIYILTQLFYRIATEPQVIIESSENEEDI